MAWRLSVRGTSVSTLKLGVVTKVIPSSFSDAMSDPRSIEFHHRSIGRSLSTPLRITSAPSGIRYRFASWARDVTRSSPVARLASSYSDSATTGSLSTAARPYRWYTNGTRVMPDHGHRRHAIRAGTRRIVKVEAADLAHARNEQTRIKAADHVSFALVGAAAQVAAVKNASIRVNAAAAVALETRRASQRLCMTARIVPELLRLLELTRWFVWGSDIHLTLTSTVSPNSPTRCSTASA